MLTLWITIAGPAHAGPFLDRNWAIYGEIIGGAAQDGDGWALLPGSGPVPIDPQWYTGTELPVVVMFYTDRFERDAIVDSLESALTAADPDPHPWSEQGRIESILGLRNDFTVVTAADESAAVAWLSANRRSVRALDHLTVLLVDEAGPGVAALARW